MTTERELYKAIGVSDYEPVDCWRKEGVFHLRMSAPSSCYRCPQCRSPDVIRRGFVHRVVHAPRIGMDRTVLFIATPRLECRICDRVLNAVLPGVVRRSNHTKSFARMVVDLRKMMTIRDTAQYLGVGEGMVRSIDKSYLQKTFGKPRLRDLEVIAIDEIYVGQKNKFFTIVIDWRSGAIVFVGEGKGQDALKPFWRRLRSSKAKIKAVATDMSSVYYAAVIKNLPNALQVFDRFHIVKLMNDKLTQLHRELQREAELMDRSVLKGTRWLLLKHSDNLDESKNEHVRLQEALDLNRSLALAYYLKEDLRQIWLQATKAIAAEFLADWCRRARASGIKVLITMANTLEGHRNGILNWYDYPISTGQMEGINNKIGALQRMAYGYKDKDYFIAKLYALHLAKFALIG